MARRLNRDDVEAALIAGLFLSAGGSGKNAVERNRAQGRAALEYGGFEFTPLNELDPTARIITATAVGAPGFAKASISWRDSVEAARLLIEKIGASGCWRNLRACAWLQCVACRLGTRVEICRCRLERTRPSDGENGRDGA